MRLPGWLRVTRRVPTLHSDGRRSVSVTIEADASRFVAACEDAAESLRRQRFRARLRLERSQGRAYVDGLLDDLCRRWGMDPVVVWREPRAREAQR